MAESTAFSNLIRASFLSSNESRGAFPALCGFTVDDWVRCTRFIAIDVLPKTVSASRSERPRLRRHLTEGVDASKVGAPAVRRAVL